MHKKKIHGFHLFIHVYILSLPDPKTIEVNGEVSLNTYHSLIFEQVLRQAWSRFCASPYHTPPMNLHANPQVSNSEVSLDEQLVQQTVRCLLWCAKFWQKYSLTHFTYERNLSCWSQEHTALICFSCNTVFSLLSHFDYFWSLVCYCSLFVIVLLFVIHFLVCSCYLSFFFAIALFVCILFLRYFSFCYYFSSLVAVKFYLCISCSLFLFHYFPCLCYTATTAQPHKVF